jgi:hypothetical protein
MIENAPSGATCSVWPDQLVDRVDQGGGHGESLHPIDASV